MTDKPTKKRPEQEDTQAAFTRLQKLTKALLGVSKEELSQKRSEFEQQAKPSERRSAGGQGG